MKPQARRVQPLPGLARLTPGVPILAVLAVLGVLFILSAPAQAGEIRVRATLEPERIGIDETTTLSIEVRGGGLRGLHFRPGFELDNLEVVGGPYQHEEILLGTGRLARSIRLSWKLRALSTGRARIHGLRIRVGGEVVSLGSREVLVQDEPTGLDTTDVTYDQEDPLDRFFRRWEPAWRERTWRRPDVFLRAEVRPLKPVVGQQVLYTVHLYTLSDVSMVSPTAVPDFHGFWVREIPQPTKLPTDMVEVEGKRYGRVVLLQRALFPLRPGRHQIQATEFDLLVRTIDRRLFGPPVSSSEQLQLKTAAMPLDVQPLPPAPPGFTGAVGRISLAANVEPAKLRLGEAATLTLTLSGEGNLQGLPEPALPQIKGLKVLPPQQEGEDKISGTTIRGSRTWSYPVIPERAGDYRLEVPGLPYFDPAAKRYELARVEPVRLTALPAPARQKSGPAPVAEAPALRPWDGLRERLPWLLAIPGVLALVLLLARRRNGAPGDGKVTDREAHRRLEHGLQEAEQESRPRQAAARIEEAWRELLAERWEIPPGTPSTRWAGLLEAKGADPDAARELVRLADDLHYLRYAPQLSTCDSMVGEVHDRCRKLLRKL